ncbi:MAG: L-threonylcarbamoyladenylate synthase [Christensenellales bacterium]
MSESKNAAKVVECFDGKISAVIDGGECGIGTESTIIDMSKTPYKILREAALLRNDKKSPCR